MGSQGLKRIDRPKSWYLRGRHNLKIIVEIRNDLLGWQPVGHFGEAAEIGKYDCRANALAFATLDLACEYPSAGIGADICIKQTDLNFVGGTIL